MVGITVATGIGAAVCVLALLRGNGDVRLASISSIIFVIVAWLSWRRILDQTCVRLVPYFEKKVGNINTWLSGKSLLLQSRRLDEMALQLGVHPLSEFASGDDMIPSEDLKWFAPQEALKTIERLLEPEAAKSLPQDVISELSQVREALDIAHSRNIRFCFLLREGLSASGAEMEQRKGSFF
jgi:hypothetical protein